MLIPVYFTNEDKEKMKTYEFQSDDNGLTSKYFFQPTAELVLKITPMWMA